MRFLNRTAALGAALALCATSALAQAPAWPADGTGPKAAATLPAPPPAAEKWNGIWNVVGGLIFDADHAVLAKDPANGAGFSYGPEGGSHFTGAPYNAKYQKIYDDTVKLAAKGVVTDPMANCTLPHGMPRIMGGGPGPMELIVRPNQVWMLFDYMNESRRIYTDGRGHAKRDEAFPLTMAHSIGRWDGDTLVVDSTDMPEGIYDRTGAPHSDQVHLMERIRLVDADTLEDQMTIEDPVAFTKPWVVLRTYDLKPTWQIAEYICEDNNRNPIKSDGTTETGVVSAQPVGTAKPKG